MLNRVEPFVFRGCSGDQLQVADKLSDTCSHLVAEEEPREGAPFTKPLFGKDFESDVLREDDSAHFLGSFEKFGIGQLVGIVLDCREDIYAPAAKLLGNRYRHMTSM